MLVDRKTGKHSMMMGPMFLHQRKTFESYNFFFSKLVGMNKDMAAVLAFGTDGKEALAQALQRNFYHALHLRCFTHFKDNCKEQLKLIPHGVQAEFLADVFGGIKNKIKEEGMYCMWALTFLLWSQTLQIPYPRATNEREIFVPKQI